MAKSFCCVPGGGNLRHYCITQDFHLNKSQNFSTSPEILSPSIHLKSFPGSMVRKSYLSGAGKYFIGENQKTTNSIVMRECVCINVFLCVYVRTRAPTHSPLSLLSSGLGAEGRADSLSSSESVCSTVLDCRQETQRHQSEGAEKRAEKDVGNKAGGEREM